MAFFVVLFRIFEREHYFRASRAEFLVGMAAGRGRPRMLFCFWPGHSSDIFMLDRGCIAPALRTKVLGRGDDCWTRRSFCLFIFMLDEGPGRGVRFGIDDVDFCF